MTNNFKENDNENTNVRKANIDEGKILSRVEKVQKKLEKKDVGQKTVIETKEDDTFILGSEGNDGVLQFSQNDISEKQEQSKELSDDANKENQTDLLFLDDDENEETKQKKPIATRLLNEAFDWVKHIAIAVIIGLLIVTFVIQRNEVIGSSMEPTLFENDQLIVQKITRLYSSGIGYGDIITIDASGLPYNDEENNIIKRVIGLPGDLVEIKEGIVYVNGSSITEKYLGNVTTSEKNPQFTIVLLDLDEYYVLGDNRPISLDSRTFGPVNKDRIIGEVLIRFHPLNSFGKPK